MILQCLAVFRNPFSYHSLAVYMFIHGELASHKRSLTHRPSSQGWASGVLGFVCMYVYMLCMGGGGGGCLCYWVGFLSYFFRSFC